jgi:hypothetical protein
MASTSALTAVVERLIERTKSKWKAKDETATIYRKSPQEKKKKVRKAKKAVRPPSSSLH